MFTCVNQEVQVEGVNKISIMMIKIIKFSIDLKPLTKKFEKIKCL